MTAAAGIGAPSFVLTHADWTVWQFQWSEWDNSAMTAGAFLPATSVTPAFLGTYTASAYPNPIKAASTAIAGLTVNALSFAEESDPATRIPGDIGDVAYFSTAAGPYQYTGKHTVAYAAIWDEYMNFKSRFDAYNTAIGAYNTLKDNYNSINAFNAQRTDPLRAVLQAPQPLPIKPCPPDVPGQYAGLKL